MTKRPVNKTKTNSSSPRFDVATLREIAGEKVFTRGVTYHEDEQVEIVAIDGARVLAKVIGSEVYRSELTGRGKKFSGECSCPAFSDWGFCKHLVATALTANDLEPGALEQASSRFTKIREHLHAKGVESLVEMIMGLADRDTALLKDLELAVAMDSADDKTLFAQFKKAIAEVTRTHGFVEYREAIAWAQGIESLLNRIASLIGSGRAELVLQLLDHFFARMDEALNNMNDSDGHGGGVYARACEIHLAACRQAKPDPIALARELFTREVDSAWDFFYGASETYSDVLGNAGLAEYRRLVSEAWQQIKSLRAGGRQVHDEQFSARYRLGAILESFAEREGDVDAGIAIRAKDLSTAYGYLGIAQLCLDHAREAEALKWAEEGLWQFDDHPDERLVFFAADLYRRTGRKEDADKLLWQTFEQLPSVELYRRLKAAAVDDLAAVEIRNRALGLLQAQISKPGRQTVARWSSPKELLLELMISEGILAEAWDVVRTHGCSDPILESLAKASEKTHPPEALAAYALRVDRLVSLGGQRNYENACRFIARMQAIRKRLGQNADQTAYLADLKRRHKAKRNFMKLIQA
jgi:uncharacterized Zn finger protein